MYSKIVFKHKQSGIVFTYKEYDDMVGMHVLQSVPPTNISHVVSPIELKFLYDQMEARPMLILENNKEYLDKTGSIVKIKTTGELSQMMFFAGNIKYNKLGEAFNQNGGRCPIYDLVSVSEPDHSLSISQAKTIQDMSRSIYSNNKNQGWWTVQDELLKGKERITLIASKLALVHSEVSEALEGLRKNLNDDHLPNRPMVEVELADTIIRILDIAGFMELDVGGAIVEKFTYNQNREDHKLENRSKSGGKTI